MPERELPVALVKVAEVNYKNCTHFSLLVAGCVLQVYSEISERSRGSAISIL